MVNERLLAAVDAVLEVLPRNTDYPPQNVGVIAVSIPLLNELRRARREVRA